MQRVLAAMPPENNPSPAAASRPSFDEHDIEEKFVAAPGPGGQNVNKVATAVELRFDVLNARTLAPAVKMRLLRLAGRRAAADGTIIIQARRFRSRERNREDARARLLQLIAQAEEAPAPRIATRPTPASRRKRLEVKKKRAFVKRLRQSFPDAD